MICPERATHNPASKHVNIEVPATIFATRLDCLLWARFIRSILSEDLLIKLSHFQQLTTFSNSSQLHLSERMPPKFDPNDPEIIKLVDLFQSIGFTKAKATETAKSPKNATALKDIIEKNKLSEQNVDDKKASLLSTLAIQGTKLEDAQKSYIVNAILADELKSSEQVTGKICFF